MTPTDLLNAAETALAQATASNTQAATSIAQAVQLIEQAKAMLVPVPPPTLYVLSVLNGSGDGTYAAGMVVAITADAAPAGQRFAAWVGATVTNPTSPSTTIMMPANAVAITATYVPVTIPPTTGRITALVHLGSFEVPVIAGGDQAGYAYGGYALGFRASVNTLYLGGFRDRALVGEISIPAFGATAKAIQNPTDPTGGKLAQIDPGDGGLKVIGGTLVVGGETLIVTAYVDYDADKSQVLSHFTRSTTLGTGSVNGPLRAGPLNAGFYSGYMALVDPAWVARFKGPALTGNACLNIITRTSFGPSVASFDPAAIGNAVELVGYPEGHTTLGPYSAASKYYGGSDQIFGMVMPFGPGSVLFFGRHGTTYCYGEAPLCVDPTSPYKGPHGYPYRTVCWLYDAAELALVAAGSKQPWDITPYDMIDVPGMNANAVIGGAAYDPATGRIYLSELRGNGTLPRIHVYEAKS